jgi:hypothetical protein
VLIHHVVEELGLAPESRACGAVGAVDGTYALDGSEAIVAGNRVTEIEREPLTGARLERRYLLSLDAPLMSWRCDFPRPDVARIGWVALPRADA